MADQAVVDLPDKFTQEWGDQFTLKAWHRAGLHTAAILQDVARELKKRPVLRKQLRRTASMIGGVHIAERGAYEAIKAGEATEAQIIAEIVEGETGYLNPRCDADVIAQIVRERERLEKLWRQVEALDDDDDHSQADGLVAAHRDGQLEIWRQISMATMAGNIVFSAEGGRAETDPASDEAEPTDRDVLADMSADVRAHLERLSPNSRWRTPFAYLADRLQAGSLKHPAVTEEG